MNFRQSGAGTADGLHLLENNLQEAIYDFLVASSTIIALNRGLTPNIKEDFTYINKFDMRIPVFRNPQAQMYIEGIAKKAVILVRQNALNSCMFHVKEARLYCHQRFYFRFHGTWNLTEDIVEDAADIMETLKTNFNTCLLKLLVKDDLKRLCFPQFSRWSMTLGLREEFVKILKENGVSNPFQYDPDSHFPWKRTLRPAKASNVATRLDFRSDCIADISKETPVPTSDVQLNNSFDNGSENLEECIKDKHGACLDSDDGQSVIHKSNDDSSEEKCAQDEDGMTDLDEFLGGESNYDSFEVDEDIISRDERDDVSCVPISSFYILNGLLLNVYVLDYSKVLEEQIQLLGAEQFLASTKGT